MVKRCLLLTNKADLKLARKAAKHWPVVLPGHHQLSVMARLDGLNVVDPNEVLPAAEYDLVCKDVADNLRLLQPIIQNYATVELGAYIMARSVRQLYLANLLNIAATRGLDLYRRDFNGRIIKASTPVEKKIICKTSIRSYVGPDGPYVLDMQSPSGKKTNVFSSKLPTANLSFASGIDILKQKLLGKNSNKILLTSVKGSQPTFSSKFGQLSNLFKQEIFFSLYTLVEIIEKNYLNSYRALEIFYSNNQLPSEAWFNHVKNSQMAALMAFLNEHGVTVKMQSHGGLHVFGSDSQELITSALSDGMYNNYPAVTDIHPRSIRQVSKLYDQQNIKIHYTPKSCLKEVNKKKFTILFAPNFLNWWEANWGIHSTCFDVVKVLKHLISLTDQGNQVELNVRIKLGLSDKQKKSDLDKMIGIDPGTISRLIEKHASVRDVTLESYEASISSADLVITEGMTSVIYDSLERGKPVLCLRAEREVRGLAAGQRPGSNDRAVVYSDSVVDFGLQELDWLAFNHFNKPLTREEVAGFFLNKGQICDGQ